MEGPMYGPIVVDDEDQCDQIGQFIGLLATFRSLWQQ